jgi:hypothetical protein
MAGATLEKGMSKPKDCHICLGPCSREVHAATMRVRKWFRSQGAPVKIKDIEEEHKHPLVGLSGSGLGAVLSKTV